MPELKTKWTWRDELQLMQLAKTRREIMEPHEKRLRTVVESLVDTETEQKLLYVALRDNAAKVIDALTPFATLQSPGEPEEKR